MRTRGSLEPMDLGERILEPRGRERRFGLRTLGESGRARRQW